MNPWDQFVGYLATGLKAIAEVYAFAGDHKWALAIITLTLIVRTLLLPVAIKQIRSMREQQRLQPEIQRLRQKHGRDRQKMTEEMMALYRREGVNPYAACLPMIAQAPVFMAMFYVIRNLTTVPAAIAKQLAPIAKDAGTTVLALAQQRGVVPKMPFLGLGDLTLNANKSAAGWLLLALMTLTQFISTRQLNPGGTDQQRRIQMLLPFFFVFIMLNFPTGLVLYWATQNLYQFVQQMIMLRGLNPSHWFSRHPPEKAKKARAAAPAPSASAAAPTPTQSFGSPLAQGFGDGTARRDLIEKRKRRRRKKKKRKR